jgi:DNA-binding CsgD family transcriptional regulator
VNAGRATAAAMRDRTSAEGCYREAVARLSRTRLLPDLARAHLLLGEWLRRENRRLDARQQLHAAHELFVSMGAEGFVERARRELQATGEKIRRREDGRRTDLTPQEEQIARLARHGRTNHEIGAEPYICVRTVEWYRRNVFPKLGITSRKGLHDPLPTRRRTADT